jgi:hypothetical protein
MSGVGGFHGRIGAKAGGFLVKKFFHPTNLKNQALLWEAQEKQRQDEMRQTEMQR